MARRYSQSELNKMKLKDLKDVAKQISQGERGFKIPSVGSDGTLELDANGQPKMIALSSANKASLMRFVSEERGDIVESDEEKGNLFDTSDEESPRLSGDLIDTSYGKPVSPNRIDLLADLPPLELQRDQYGNVFERQKDLREQQRRAIAFLGQRQVDITGDLLSRPLPPEGAGGGRAPVAPQSASVQGDILRDQVRAAQLQTASVVEGARQSKEVSAGLTPSVQPSLPPRPVPSIPPRKPSAPSGAPAKAPSKEPARAGKKQKEPTPEELAIDNQLRATYNTERPPVLATIPEDIPMRDHQRFRAILEEAADAKEPVIQYQPFKWTDEKFSKYLQRQYGITLDQYKRGQLTQQQKQDILEFKTSYLEPFPVSYAFSGRPVYNYTNLDAESQLNYALEKYNRSKSAMSSLFGGITTGVQLKSKPQKEGEEGEEGESSSLPVNPSDPFQAELFARVGSKGISEEENVFTLPQPKLYSKEEGEAILQQLKEKGLMSNLKFGLGIQNGFYVKGRRRQYSRLR